MADEETIIINGVGVVMLKGTCNYSSRLASLQRALEVPDPDSWQIITGKKHAPQGADISSFLESKDFARRYVAETRGITSEAVSEQEVKTCLSDLETVGLIVGWRESEIYGEWVEKDNEARDILESTISGQVEYDLEIECDDDACTASGYFSQLQAKYGPTGYLSRHKKWNEWTKLQYRGEDDDVRRRFVYRFKTAKAELDQALSIPIEPRCEFLQFLSAISGHPECEGLLTDPLQKYNEIKDGKEMEQLYFDFIWS